MPIGFSPYDKFNAAPKPQYEAHKVHGALAELLTELRAPMDRGIGEKTMVHRNANGVLMEAFAAQVSPQSELRATERAAQVPDVPSAAPESALSVLVPAAIVRISMEMVTDDSGKTITPASDYERTYHDAVAYLDHELSNPESALYQQTLAAGSKVVRVILTNGTSAWKTGNSVRKSEITEWYLGEETVN